MPQDLLMFMRARLDEDFAAVRLVLGVSVVAAIRHGESAPRWVPSPKSDTGVWDTNGVPRVKYAWPRERAHIIRHDPARVLAEVEAKRVLVDEFERCGPNNPRHSVLHFTVRVLAAVYDGHPDYREEWRP
ncbi:DUF6221 family protein [Streptomyces violaceusniger]|nr:DUF6221 family protein [Streptomyces violaceusniger]